MSVEGTGSEGASDAASILVDAAPAANTNDIAAASVTAEQSDAEVLALHDVLRSEASPDANGICLSFESVGNGIVIRVDADGAGPVASIPIATIDNVIGLTLQQLLNNDLTT